MYNGTTSGLTEVLWTPKFWLPTSATMSRKMFCNYKIVDLDAGEMFLNYPLDEEIKNVSGLDFSSIARELREALGLPPSDEPLYGRWGRIWMGLKFSPEHSVRYYYWSEEFARGDEENIDNPLCWHEIKLNIMGQDDFDPSLPNVVKWDSHRQRPAGDIGGYIDDLRAIGYDYEHAWRIARAIASRMEYRGQQDAARKRRIKEDGPWTGCVFGSNEGDITRSVTLEKWAKARRYVQDIRKEINSTKEGVMPRFEYKFLERVRGFFCHLAMTFSIIFPFLKGFHLTLSAHLPKRDSEGWKISELEWIGSVECKVDKGTITREEGDFLISCLKDYDKVPKPTTVQVVPRFLRCFVALEKLFAEESPPSVHDRAATYNLLVYGFVDASKSGLGASIDTGKSLSYRIGTWGKDSEDESSNWREFNNLVETLEEEAKLGNLDGAFMVIATDNQVAEACLFKGNSVSEKLYDLIVRLRCLELKHGAQIIVTHVSGQRMILQGTDGYSRGETNLGIGMEKSMTHFCPWHKFPSEFSPELLPWVKSWLPSDAEVLKPKDWFKRAHDHFGGYRDQNGFYQLKLKKGIYVWDLPPGATNVAIEQLRIARLKRRDSFHILLIPKLCTTQWLKQLYKEADLIVNVPPIHSFWNKSCCENLTIAFCFPYLSFKPWKLARTPKLCAMERSLRRMFKDNNLDSRSFLSKFWKQIYSLYSMPKDMVSSVLYFEKRNELPNEEG